MNNTEIQSNNSEKLKGICLGVYTTCWQFFLLFMSYPVPSRGVIHFQKCRRFAGEGTKLQNSYILDNKIVKKKWRQSASDDVHGQMQIPTCGTPQRATLSHLSLNTVPQVPAWTRTCSARPMALTGRATFVLKSSRQFCGVAAAVTSVFLIQKLKYKEVR